MNHVFTNQGHGTLLVLWLKLLAN